MYVWIYMYVSCSVMSDSATPGSSIHGIFQASILEWVAISFSRESSLSRGQTRVSCIGRWILYHCPAWEAPKATLVKVTQLCPTLCHPVDCTVHGILQARILEWVAFPFSRGSSQPRDRTQVSHIAGRFFTSWATKEATNWYTRTVYEFQSFSECLWQFQWK